MLALIFSVPNKILLLCKLKTCGILYNHAFNTLMYNNLVIAWVITDIPYSKPTIMSMIDRSSSSTKDQFLDHSIIVRIV